MSSIQDKINELKKIFPDKPTTKKNKKKSGKKKKRIKKFKSKNLSK